VSHQDDKSWWDQLGVFFCVFPINASTRRRFFSKASLLGTKSKLPSENVFGQISGGMRYMRPGELESQKNN
jgi:hypothetical protein